MFALAMGYLEAAVVVYLRTIFYPEGFAFPIRAIGPDLAFVELGREAATIVMLLAVAFLAERTRRGRFAGFMLLFGLWDLAYYFFLRVTISWPESLLTWDLLFLIPLIWTGPVLAPVLVSILMVVSASLYFARRGAAEAARISGIEWAAVVVAAGIIFTSFVLNHFPVYRGAMPGRFAWEIFAAGMLVGVTVLVRFARRVISPA
jgi:hypothetical protein